MNLFPISTERWLRVWRCQISYAYNAKTMDEFDLHCKNAMVAQVNYLIAQVLQ